MTIEAAYQALLDLGVALADGGHTWSPEERSAWERAECALRALIQ